MNSEKLAFTDIHAHIIPAIDDGSRSNVDSMTMLRQAYADGTRYLVATPHVIWKEHQPDWAIICDECQKLNAQLRAEKLNITVFPGAEIALLPEMLMEIKEGEYCINNGKYMLVELPMLQMPKYADAVIFGLQAKGIVPIMAHPERYPDVVNNPGIVLHWLAKGMLLQVNAMSITGLFGSKVQDCAMQLLANRVVSFVASDAHSVRGRNMKLKSAFDIVLEKCGCEYAEKVFCDNPRAALYSEKVQTELPDRFVLPKRKSIFGRFFRSKK